jgi:hypothetical protein
MAGYLVALAVSGAIGALAINHGTFGSPAVVVLAAVLLGVAAWMFLSERMELTLAVLLLYLGLADGFLKLKTGSSVVTAGRDVLLYAIAGGATARTVVRRGSLRMPPMSGWILSLVGIVLVQTFNPANAGISHTLGGIRPHLEFVPLFFLAYVVMRSVQRVRILLFLCVVVAAANGVVSLMQWNLTPQQLSAWGPGYALRLSGKGDVAARTFVDKNRTAHVRPFGLGADVGVGGNFGVIGLMAAIALGAYAWKRKLGRWALLLTPLVLLAIVTSQGRTVLVASFIGVLAYVVLSTVGNRLIPTLCAVSMAFGLALVVVVPVLGGASSGSFDRYKTITPSNLLTSTDSSRGSSLAKILKYPISQPQGGGLGFVGPAASFGNTARGNRSVDGETGFTYLLSELGVVGLIVLLGFNIKLLVLAVKRVRLIPDPELRGLLAGCTAVIAATLMTWTSGPPMATSPAAPFFWTTAGIFAYWLGGPAHAWRARTFRQS